MKNKLKIIILLLFCALVCDAFSTDTKKFFNSGKVSKEKAFPFTLYSNQKFKQLKSKTFFVVDKKLTRQCLVAMEKQDKAVVLLGESKHARHNVYSALIAGAKGIFIKAKKLDKKYFELSKELTGKKKISQVFLSGKLKRDLKIKIIDGPESIRYNNKEYPSAAMANIAYKNSRYLFIVNSSNKTLELIVEGLVYGSSVTVQDIFIPEENFTAPEGDFELEIKALEVKVFIIYNKINH
jgi:hypothetical protein